MEYQARGHYILQTENALLHYHFGFLQEYRSGLILNHENKQEIPKRKGGNQSSSSRG